jgi:hypothetical protein
MAVQLGNNVLCCTQKRTKCYPLVSSDDGWVLHEPALSGLLDAAQYEARRRMCVLQEVLARY